MHFHLILFLGILSYAASKSNTKALTESMGQEVIEIGAPIKELPPDLEEEPSADADEIDNKVTSTTLHSATPREAKKDTTIETRRKVKDIDKIDNVKQEDDEARIEKELAEMYKDTDYKADNGEAVLEDTQSTSSANGTEKPIGRMRENFKFQPDGNDPKDVERFRTSIDDISCAKNKLLGDVSIFINLAGVAKTSNTGQVVVLCRMMLWAFFIII